MTKFLKETKRKCVSLFYLAGRATVANNIFQETQDEIDYELSLYSGLKISKIKSLAIASPASIRLYEDKDIQASSYEFIYKKYVYLETVDYLRTLSTLTVERRSSYIKDLEKNIGGFKDKRILDYGCGVGSHGIYCSQKGAIVDLLDVDGPLYNYAKWRVTNRKIKINSFFYPDSILCKNMYNAVICLDVLEHIADPIASFNSISDSLVTDGLLSLEVSSMVKPTSGHFSQSVHSWQRNGNALVSKNFYKINNYLFRKK
jgi:SAM-dependent methyltransferase